MRRTFGRAGLFVVGGAVATVMASSWVAGCSADINGELSVDSGGPIADGTVFDAPANDGASEIDVLQDAPATDAGPMDAFAGDDASMDADASDQSSVIPTPDQVTDYPHAVDRAYCLRLQQCCGVPVARWEQDQCASLFDQFRGALGIGRFNDALDSGTVGYDKVAATNCLTTLSTINCGSIPQAAYGSLVSLCFSAMPGTLAVDSGTCTNSLQCKKGEYCAFAQDGGPGVCATLHTAGEACSDPNRSTDCTYLGNGTGGLYCAPVDGGGRACTASQSNGAACNWNADCQSGECNSPICVDSFSFSTPMAGFCSYFTMPPDAGGGDAGAGNVAADAADGGS